MSKEAMERILRAEADARDLVETAKNEAEQSFNQAENKISEERAAFYEKLKAERNEKMRRVDMQMQIKAEEAQKASENAYNEAKAEYKKYLDEAINEAINTVLN